ncbi:DUF3343 domain-containing protein [Candidatus Contubernalis alkaliaceticus]|uniref:DUF3343 domain-containing protein n=1 Tax=Candidatus Contubernalis alkaliaceticus TaxID=338645 RepID=UPI001F4C2E88|nr:DUF3343 domain-containing protein [Candidatus Contubernalis alkalaceticus]UNC91887.1 DUF3343 domain-containing protein [Candidatus Contubernalis alkalaceticus]
MIEYYVATFYSTNYALKCEKILKNSSVNIKLIPVPRQVSSNCGLAARMDMEALAAFFNLLKEGVIEVEDLFRVEKEGNNLKFTPLHDGELKLEK